VTGGSSGISLSSAGDHIDVAGTDTLELANELTVSAWINVSDVPSLDERVISKAYSWDVKLNGVSRFPQFSAAGRYAMLDYLLPAGEWQHVVFTFRSGAVRGYINGAPVAFAQNTFSDGVTLPLYRNGLLIGTDAEKTSGMQGAIDDVRIYSRALADEEVSTLYSETVHY
jgi:hypothetical protein